MPVRLEFFGIPRQRAGVPEFLVEAVTLGEAITVACRELPRLAECQAANGDVAASCLANINGKQFTRDGNTRLHDGDEVLILSADVGG
jgi:molybdopterin converting factor small subunit